MDNIETGLYLPIRFYLTSNEQDRYKRHSLGVALTELNYPHVDCTSLAPFQLTYDTDGLFGTADILLICADSSEQVVLPFNALSWEEVILATGEHYLSYLGTDDFSGLTHNGLFYLQVSNVTGVGDTITYYSDLFRISNCDSTPYDVEEFRIYSPSQSDIRAIDTTDLRIV